MTEKRPLTSYDQMFGRAAAKRVAIFMVVLFIGIVLLAAAITA